MIVMFKNFYSVVGATSSSCETADISIISENEPPAKKTFFSWIDARAEKQSQGTNTPIADIWQSWAFSTTQQLPNELKQLYEQYNTTLPSSAPVERLFSLAKRVLSPTRSLLSDEYFELCVLVAEK